MTRTKAISDSAMPLKPKAVPWAQLAIDRSEILQSLLNLETKTRSNPLAWTGQFSPEFVELLLKHYASKDDIVFDSFLGSGTTLAEAARLGIRAFGTELNYSAYYMAKTYELANFSLEAREKLLSAIDCLLATIANAEEIVPKLTAAIKQLRQQAAYQQAEVLSTLVILLDLGNKELSLALLSKKWAGLKDLLLTLPYSEHKITALRSDSRAVAVAPNSASLLLTSPPYINVFNYHQKYRKSVEALGYEVLQLAKQELGSNRKHRSNRFLTVIQYCLDLAFAMAEAMRICQEGARMIYVVGRESKVLGYSFSNSQLLYEIATEIFGLPCLLRQERVFKNRYGQLICEDILHFQNTPVRALSKDPQQLTKILEASSKLKAETASLSPNQLVEQARAIAVRMLKEKLT